MKMVIASEKLIETGCRSFVLSYKDIDVTDIACEAWIHTIANPNILAANKAAYPYI